MASSSWNAWMGGSIGQSALVSFKWLVAVLNQGFGVSDSHRHCESAEVGGQEESSDELLVHHVGRNLFMRFSRFILRRSAPFHLQLAYEGAWGLGFSISSVDVLIDVTKTSACQSRLSDALQDENSSGGRITDGMTERARRCENPSHTPPITRPAILSPSSLDQRGPIRASNVR
ncbi:hypothetical protein PG997_002820 [Apiospora hydei]|uniref:Uncharacterized protein n=1 Tax=Apiospora hydei TaxID=1337664 RepID=A0ABR1WXL0_9PEZI